MALKRVGNVFTGLSTDDKPTGKVRTGFLFVETDTKEVFVYITDKWYAVDDQTEAS
jgi:hypothetical protein